MLSLKNFILTFTVLIVGLIPESAKADQFDIFKATWEFFKQECSLVMNNPYKYIEGNGGTNEKITTKVSDDGKAYAFTKGNGDINGDRERYMETFIDIYEDREVINCSVNYEKWKVFNSKEMASKMTPWLLAQNLSVAGGFIPLYDKSYHQFGVLGVFPERDLPVRVRLYDWGIQFFVDETIKK